MKVVFGAFADELVIRFADSTYPDTVVVPVATPNRDYASLLVADETGDVIGVHVMPLLVYAAKRHPAWIEVAGPFPAPDAAQRIVEDIKLLFDRYGVVPDDSELE
jgi:hypothetical protein